MPVQVKTMLIVLRLLFSVPVITIGRENPEINDTNKVHERKYLE